MASELTAVVTVFVTPEETGKSEAYRLFRRIEKLLPSALLDIERQWMGPAVELVQTTEKLVGMLTPLVLPGDAPCCSDCHEIAELTDLAPNDVPEDPGCPDPPDVSEESSLPDSVWLTDPEPEDFRQRYAYEGSE